MLTIKYTDDIFHRLRYEKEMNKSRIIRKRCSALYMKLCNPSLCCDRIASLCGCHRNSVRNWILQYNREGLSALLSTHPHHRSGELASHASVILSSLDSSPVRSVKEACARIKEVCGVDRKPTQVRHFLKSHGYKFRKMGQVPGKANSVLQKQWLDFLQLYITESQAGKCRLLFSDAVHFTLSAFVCNVWSRERVYLKTAAGRNRLNVLGAVDAVTKEVFTVVNTTYITAETVEMFLQRLRDMTPDIPIAVVMDNARYQHCKAVMDKAKELGIQLLFLPPDSPNLNIIERLWKFIKKSVLYGRYYDKPVKFHQAIKDFLKEINSKHQSELNTLLTLNFQIIDSENAHFDAA